MGDKYKIMRPEHSEHPELTGRQVGDKCEIMRPEHSEHPELTGRQVGNKWDTSIKSCGQSTQSTQSFHLHMPDFHVVRKCMWQYPVSSVVWDSNGSDLALGDKWETSVKSCGQSTQSIQSLLGDKWETSGRQMGDKCEIMRPSTQRSRAYWETSGRQIGDKPEIMRPEH